MQGKIARFLLLLAAPAVLASTAPMSSVRSATPGRCHVVGAEKLLRASGGADTICAAVEKAVHALAPTARYSVEVKVLSPSKLSAALVVNGRLLPQQNFAIMDSELDPGAVQRFARSLAMEIAKAAKS